MLPRMRLLFVGDSVTAGFRLVDGTAYPHLAADRLADRGLAVDVLVDALDGADTGYVLRRFDRMVTSHDPDFVVVALGLNDARPPQGRTPVPVERFRSNLAALVDRVLSLGARCAVQTPTPRFDEPVAAASTTRDCMSPYVAAVRETARALRLPLIDVYPVLLSEPRLETLVPDGVHPTAAGHELLADVVTEELLAIVRPAPSASNQRARR